MCRTVEELFVLHIRARWRVTDRDIAWSFSTVFQFLPVAITPMAQPSPLPVNLVSPAPSGKWKYRVSPAR